MTVAIVAFFFALFPAGATWVNDDPALIHQAVIANREGVLARSGLVGSLGIPYGPLAIQIYQLMLVFTHNPIVLVSAHAVLMAGVTGIALLYLGRTLKLPFWYGALLLMSPWQWVMSRSLWDNSFNLPLGAVLLASYAAFLTEGKARWLVVAICSGVAMITVHFMALPFVAAVFAHIIYKNFRHLRRVQPWVAVMAATVFLTQGPYIIDVAKLASSRLMASSSAGTASVTSSVKAHAAAFFFPLQGGWALSGLGLPLEWVGSPAALKVADRLLTTLSLSAYPLVWAGILMAIAECAFVRNTESNKPLRKTILWICLVSLLLQMVLDGALGLDPLQHYFNATYVIFAVFAWLAVANIKRTPVRLLAGGVHGVGMVGIVLYLLFKVHVTGAYGATPTLGVQRQVVDEFSKYSNTTAVTDIDFFKMCPHCLWTLAELEGRAKGAVHAESLWVHKMPPDAEEYVIVVEDKKPPAGSGRFDLRLTEEVRPR